MKNGPAGNLSYFWSFQKLKAIKELCKYHQEVTKTRESWIFCLIDLRNENMRTGFRVSDINGRKYCSDRKSSKGYRNGPHKHVAHSCQPKTPFNSTFHAPCGHLPTPLKAYIAAHKALELSWNTSKNEEAAAGELHQWSNRKLCNIDMSEWIIKNAII